MSIIFVLVVTHILPSERVHPLGDSPRRSGEVDAQIYAWLNDRGHAQANGAGLLTCAGGALLVVVQAYTHSGNHTQYTTVEGMDDADNNTELLTGPGAPSGSSPHLWWWGKQLCLPLLPATRRPKMYITAKKHNILGSSTLDMSAALSTKLLQNDPGDPVAWWVPLTPGTKPKTIGQDADTAAAIKDELVASATLASVVVSPPPQVLLCLRCDPAGGAHTHYHVPAHCDPSPCCCYRVCGG